MPMDANTLQELAAKLRGPLILPDSPEYDTTRAIWNGMIDKRPGAIVRCLGSVDVIECVNFARENGVELSIRGGGHNISGLALTEGGLMADLSLMRGVWVDKENKIARCQAGCILGDVDRETQAHGLAAVMGFVSNTGIAGLTLGGGFGYLTSRWGWTSDTVVGMDVVTRGRPARPSQRQTENPDLFWALRGGGGNFGVLTGIDYKLYEVGPQIMGGAVAWKVEDAPEVLKMYKEIYDNSPPEMAVVAALRKAPPAPWLPEDMHGKLIVALFVCHTGSLEQAEKDCAPIKAFGTPDWRRASAQAVHRTAGHARSDAAQRPPLLLEVRVDVRRQTGNAREGDRARTQDRIAALGNSRLSAGWRDPGPAGRSLGGRRP